MRFPGESVIGSTIMPLSDLLTRSTSDACSSIDRFLWMTPMPPCCAMAMASRDSVTVSIAALTSGTDRRMWRVSRVDTSTWVGVTSECRGTSSTSSKVRAVARPVSVESSVGISVFSSIGFIQGRGNLWRGCRGGWSRRRPMALLVFLAAAARARIVAADFWFVASDRLDDVVSADARRLRSASRSRRPPGPRCRRVRTEDRARGRFARRIIHDERRPAWRCPSGCGHSRAFVQDRPQPPQVANDLFVDALLHSLKEIEAFFLVLDERIALAVAAKPDAFLQMVEAVEMVLPLLVDDLQHDVALDPLQD